MGWALQGRVSGLLHDPPYSHGGFRVCPLSSLVTRSAMKRPTTPWFCRNLAQSLFLKPPIYICLRSKDISPGAGRVAACLTNRIRAIEDGNMAGRNVNKKCAAALGELCRDFKWSHTHTNTHTHTHTHTHAGTHKSTHAFMYTCVCARFLVHMCTHLHTFAACMYA